MAAPLKISARVEIDAAQAKQGAAASVAAVDSIGTAAERNTTKLQALVNASTGIGGGAANRNVREWTGALAMQGKSLDELRAKYNPLFATITQYKAALTEIRTLHDQGVLSTNEMTAAIQRQRQAALASIDAIKGRGAALRAEAANANVVAMAGGRGVNSHVATNAMFQFQDIAMTAAMGMNPGMIALQQGTQLASAFAGMGIKEAATTSAAALASMVNRLSLTIMGLTAATAAAIQFGGGLLSSGNEADKLDKILERHASTVRELAQRWGDVLEKSSQYGQRSSAAIGFGMEMSTAQLRKSLREQVDGVLENITDATGDNLSQIGGARAFRNDPMYGLLSEEVTRLVEAARNGSPDIVGLSRRIAELANTSNNSGVRTLADDIILAIAQVEELARRLQEAERNKIRLFNTVGSNGMLLSRGLISQQDSTNSALFESRERVAADRSRIALDAELHSLKARSPQDRAEAARQSAASQYRDDETAPARRLRIEQAGILTLAQAEKELADARYDRARSLDDTLAQQRLELSLIGQTVAEQERLRMEHRLTAELKAEAARNGIEVDQAELARVQALSAEYGRLAEAMTARRALDGQDQDLAALRTRLALIGQTEEVRGRVLVQLEAERRLREMGLSLGSREAEQYRRNAEAIAEATEQLRKQEAAWSKVRGTAENTIDTLFDRFAEGDFLGGLETIAKDWSKTILQLGAANPLKNALLGTNHETMGDIGGLGGMFSKLFGGGVSTASMSVNAATVSIAGGLPGAGNILGGVANDNTPGAMSAYRSAISAIESGGRYDALGPITRNGDRAYGKYQVMGANIGPWSRDALGRSISAEEFLQNPKLQDRIFDHRFGGYVDRFGPSGAAQAWFGGPGSVGKGGIGADMLGTTGASYVAKFNAQLDKATSGLSQFDGGLGKLGSTLETLMAPGGGSGLLSGLTRYGMGAFSGSSQFAAAMLGGGIGLFDRGGPTGGSDPSRVAGLVHEREFVFDAAATARIGVPNLEAIRRDAMRGYRDGGYVSVGQAYPTPMRSDRGDGHARGGFSQVIHNYSGAPVRTEERDDGRGGRRQDVIIGETVAGALGGGNPLSSALEHRYGLRPGMVRR